MTAYKRNQFKGFALRTTSAAAIIACALISNSAFAQSTSSTSVEEVQVTGTRVVRDGYSAPTPTTVVGAQQIQDKAPANIAQLVDEMPELANSATPVNYGNQVSSGLSGINALNLRALGPVRTLVLLDGERLGASTLTGLVDINQIPEQLVKRVDIVTGGASADYGSDAVAGVVNFVLDKDFVGVKSELQGGGTSYGDDANYKGALTIGQNFLGDRLHVLLSLEYAYNDGIKGVPRPWATNQNETLQFNNPNSTPTNGQPALLVRNNAGFATATPGGIITAGPLQGIYFGPGGTPAQFQYGPIVSGNFMQGGQSAYTNIANVADLDTLMSRQNAYFRTSYNLTDHIQIYGEASWAKVVTHENSLVQFNFANLTVQPDNAFIPASIASKVTAPLTMGSFNQDLGPIPAYTRRSNERFTLGATGDFDALGTNWAWDVHGHEQITNVYLAVRDTITANYKNALDAVKNTNGAIVCRSTLSSPNNGCVPYDVFGTGVNSQAVLNYVLGTSEGRTQLKQNNEALNVRGNPFSNWAGPISVAFGFEHRQESVSGSNDPLSTTNSYFTGNFHASFGTYDVNEGYFETVIPLLKDVPFAKSLDLTGAVRETDYSTSGLVTTWKVGATWAPIDDLKFRMTQSRDIRAPDLAALFNASQTSTNVVVDPTHANASSSIFQITSGNKALNPEVADTTSLGVVVTPTFLDGFQASVDWYRIDLNNAITTFTAQQAVNLCAQGNTVFCSGIVRNGAGTITQVNVTPVNVAQQIASGLDFEASYRRTLDTDLPWLNGDLTFRFQATKYLKNYTNNAVTAPTDNVGTNSNNGSQLLSLPSFQWLTSVTWDHGPLGATLTAHGISDGVVNTSFIQCTSGCPASTTANMTTENNFVPGSYWFDASVRYDIEEGLQAYLAVDNLANRAPVMIGYGPTFGAAPLSVNASAYDVIGRMFRGGVRFQL